MSDVLAALRGIKDELFVALELEALAPHLPESLVSEALEIAGNIRDEEGREWTLSALAERLPERALEQAASIQDVNERLEAFSALAPYFWLEQRAQLLTDGLLHSGSDLMADTLAESAVSRRLLGRFITSSA